MANTRALIIGLDGYAQEAALTSAIRDATQFRDALIQRKLVDARDVELLTLPVTTGASPATAKAIRDRLYHYYANGDQIDRFYFFYAGHGILANANASRTRTHTVLVPTECEDFRRDAAYLWPFDELRETLERCGPREQFYIIDACRDLVEGRNPDVGTLGFSGATGSYARSQSVLFSVSPLGTAKSTKHGLGVMTGHLLDALRSDRIALDYDDEQDRFAITIQSLKRYAEARIRASLDNEPSWTLRYQLPELRSFGPSASSLVVVESPPAVPLAVHIEPELGAAEAHISVSLRGSPVQAGWPPLANHQQAMLGPQKYTLTAQHRSLKIDPAVMTIDLRQTEEAHFLVQPGEPRDASAGPAAPQIHEVRDPRGLVTGTIKAVAVEPATVIELEGQSPPYLRLSRPGYLEQDVGAGTYRVRFRLGAIVQSEAELEISPGTISEVRPPLEASLLLYEILGTDNFVESATFSETIGPMQSGVLQTLLAMIAIKHFDVAGRVFHQLTNLIRPQPPERYRRRPVAVVIAVDGAGWIEQPDAILRGVACDIYDDHSSPGRQTTPVVPLDAGSAGYARIGIAITAPVSRSFPIVVRSPVLGVTRVVAASLDDRATVVTLIFHADGRVDAGQSILRFPGDPIPDAPSVPFGRLVRDLQLAQLLYRSHELIEHMLRSDDAVFRALRDATWIDPVATAMACFARRRAIADGLSTGAQHATIQLDHRAAQHLRIRFGTVPDCQIAYALAFPHERTQVLDELLDANAVPIVADAAVELAARARETGRTAAVITAVETMTPGQVWCLRREAPTHG